MTILSSFIQSTPDPRTPVSNQPSPLRPSAPQRTLRFTSPPNPANVSSGNRGTPYFGNRGTVIGGHLIYFGSLGNLGFRPRFRRRTSRGVDHDNHLLIYPIHTRPSHSRQQPTVSSAALCASAYSAFHFPTQSGKRLLETCRKPPQRPSSLPHLRPVALVDHEG